MTVFAVLVFALIGLLGGLESYYLLFLVLLPLGFCCYREKSARPCLYLLATLAGVLFVLGYPKGNAELTSVTGLVIFRRENYYLLWSWSGKYYVYDKGGSLGLFSLVRLTGYVSQLSFTHYESQFSFEDYLKTQGVFKQFFVKDQAALFSSPLTLDWLKTYVFSFLDTTSQSLVGSLIFGDSLDPDTFGYLADLGLTSLLSLSGFHLSFLLAVIERWIPKLGDQRKRVLTLGILSVFLMLSSFRYSLRRLFLLALLRVINPHLKNRLSSLEQLSISALIMLLAEPYSLLSPAFYASYPLLIFLALFRSGKEQSKGKIALLLLLFFLPIRLFSQSGIYPLGMLFQILLIPYSHLIFLGSCLLFLVPQSGIALGGLIKGFLGLASWINQVDLFLPTGKPGWVWVLLFYGLLLLAAIVRTYGFKRYYGYAIAALSLTVLVSLVPDYLPKTELDFIDVGQGSSTLVRTGRENILIDTGGNIRIDLATETLIPYFRARKIRKLDAVIITHLDYDHYGALKSLCSSFPVAQVCYAEDFLKTTDHSLTFQSLKVTNLNDFEITTDTNSQSGVYSFSIGKAKVLITGDAPIVIEKKLIQSGQDIDADILVLGHHGSKTSSCLEFLKAVSPQLAIISCGEGNSYGFPHQEVLNNLSYCSIPYRRTDQEGTIRLSLNDGLF